MNLFVCQNCHAGRLTAPDSKHRVTIIPAKRGKESRKLHTTEADDRTSMERHASMTWARRLKRVFNINISECEKRQGAVTIIACIEDSVVIEKIPA